MPVSMPCAGDRILTCGQKRQVKSRDFHRRRNQKGGEKGGAGEENSGEERHEGERKMKAGKTGQGTKKMEAEAGKGGKERGNEKLKTRWAIREGKEAGRGAGLQGGALRAEDQGGDAQHLPLPPAS